MSKLETVESPGLFESLYQSLNPAQREAVEAIEGPVMVIAGPGTGKTQILAMRIANILRNPDLQANPSNILCLTFTESAVTAMRNRLISIIGAEAYYVRIHTFHSFCNDIIRENPNKFTSINPLSELERIEIFNEIIDGLDISSPLKPFGDTYLYRNDLINLIQTLKRESISVEKLQESIIHVEKFITKNFDLLETFVSRNARSIKEHEIDEFIEHLHVSNPDSEFVTLIQEFRDRSEKIADFKKQVKEFYEKNQNEIPKQKDLVKVYEAYEAKLKSHKLYDFEDMILRVIRQFENDSALLARYQEQFQYILVDEYQDSNGAQNRVIEMLVSGVHQKNPNLFVVGDDDQSIYRFQGASLENLIYFYKRYQDFIKLVVLTENYRSQQKILDLAQQSINYNDARISKLVPSITKTLESSGQAASYESLDIELIKASNIYDEVYQISERIQSLIANGTAITEIAVLFRENKEAELLLDLLSRLQIPARIDAGDNILEDILVCQLIDLVKLIHNPQAGSALLFNVLNYNFVLESESFTLKDVFKVNQERSKKREETTSFFDYLLEDSLFKAWAEKILKFNQQAHNQRFDVLLERITKDFGYLDFILKKPDYFYHINRLDSLFKEIRSLVVSPLRDYKVTTLKAFSVEDFIKYINLMQENNLKIESQALNVDSNAIKLMTAHRSKGLEFDYVFIYSCIDKRWGNKTIRTKIKLPPKLIRETDSLISDDKNEDDRRLFYVALTRARKGLYLSYHAKNDRDQDTVPSIFISEVAAHESINKQESNLSAGEELKKIQIGFLDKVEECIKEDDYIDGLLENYKLSVTHLNNYLECPRKFFYQNLIRVPSAKNKHASFGTAVHEALCDLFKILKTKKLNQEQAQELLLTAFEKHLKEENLIAEEYEDSLNLGKNALKKYLAHYYDGFITNTELEFDFSGYGLNLDGTLITGKIDKIEFLDDRKINVIDYKTGNPSSKFNELKPGGDYYRQIVFYQLLCDLARTSKQYSYQMVSAEIDFIQTDRDEKFIKRKFHVSEEDLVTLKAEIKDTHIKIQNHCFEKTTDTKICDNCNFKNICFGN